MELLPQQSRQFVVHEGFAKAREHALTQWLHSDTTPRAIIDSDLNIHWINISAEKLITRDNIILLHGGKIRPRDKRCYVSMKEFISNISQDSSSYCVKSSQGDEHLILIAGRLPNPFSHYISVVFRLSSIDLHVKVADLGAAFGLTRTEARVAGYLLSGQTAEETARAMRVSLETTRTHIKRAYAKMGVSSREAFFYRLLPFIVFAA